MATTKMKLRVRKKAPVSSISQAMSAEASPDSKCPICLDKFKNMAYLDLCLHKFCFRCIHEWSKNKAECPLCKQPFNSIFHSIKAENDFKKYDLRPTENGSFGNLGGQRFRYRTTVTGDRRRPQRRTSPPPDNGVMFESLASPASPRQDRSLHRMMMRLAARRRAENEGRAMRALQEQELIKFRRALYRRGVRVRSVRDNGRTRDTSAEFFQRNPACLHRLVPWLKRELTVLYGAHGSLVNIVQHIIMSQITRYNMEEDAIVQELRPFLQARTEHFVHEFINFARSPYNMEAYDQHAVYDCPAPSSEEDSSSNSSVIAISEDEEDSVGLNSNPNSMTGSTLSQTPWDDETPGPSYSTEPVQTMALSVRDSDSESSVEEADGPVATQGSPPVTVDGSAQARDHASSGEDDCLIVGYVKPMAERTPELVQLSSDSEESVQDESTAAPKQPMHIHFGSELNSPASVSSSSTKHKSTEKESPRLTGGKENERNTPEKGRDPGLVEGSPSSDQHTSSSLALNPDKGPEDRSDRRHRARDHTRSRSGSWSRSRSHDRSSHSSRRHSRSRSQSRDHFREGNHPDRRHDKQGGDHSVCGREAAPHAYHWHSYSHYSCERDRSRKHYTEKRSSYTSYYISPDRHSRPRSRSRSRSHSRESRRRERRHSRSRSSSDSRSSHRKSKHDKPGGKRKYKTRHLEEPAPKNGASKQLESAEDGVKERKSSKEKHGKKSRERSMKRSPSVEIVYEGKSGDQTRRHHKKKKKHKKKSKRHRSKDRSSRHSPVIITIDSDSDHATNTKDLTCPIGSNSDVDDPIPNLSPPLVPSSNPAGGCLLDSILQHWEQQFPTVSQSVGASVMTDPPDPLTGEADPVTSQPNPLAGSPHPLTSQPVLLINQSGPSDNQTGYLTDSLDSLTDPPSLLTDPPHSLTSEPDPLVNQPDFSANMPDGSTETLNPLIDTSTTLSDPPHSSTDDPGSLTHQLETLVEQSNHLTNQQNPLTEPHTPVADPADKQESLGGACDVPLC
ncbi:topoisomerase I binding, arginine/serine-rich a [Alosa alosa]|uniref:topoisomerase I binding, arginine/serine-rich a n=1 Tax=Alosa alosa TaxID=278164 RepID=UPI00201537C2|nr:topoisomerase I binding, arginine/serine-rich a [Alosa alosa]